MDLSVCQCPTGMLRGPCKHKQVVAEHFKIVSSDLIPENDPRIRAFYHYLATGTRQNTSQYRQLNQEDLNEDDSSNTADIFGFMRTESSTNQLSSHEANYSDKENGGGDILEESIDMDIELDSEPLTDTETTKEEFRVAIVDFKDEVLKRIDEDPLNYSKCVRSFTKQLKT